MREQSARRLERILRWVSGISISTLALQFRHPPDDSPLTTRLRRIASLSASRSGLIVDAGSSYM